MAALTFVIARAHDLAIYVAALPGGWFIGSMGNAAVVFIASLLAFLLLEWLASGDVSRYRTRHFWNDVVYGLFYRGGLYQLLIGGIIAAALAPRVAFLQLHLFHEWPLPAAAIAFWIMADFLGYWLHRLQHANRFLWAFHRVHHAQERLTFLTTYRIHPIEQALASIGMLVPLAIIGPAPDTWLPLMVSLTALEFAQHADLPWRYGGLYQIVVSPVFHALHHSTEREHYDRNFGKILGIWDRLFGTMAIGERPVRFGVSDVRIPESLWAQLLSPMVMLREPARVGPERSSSSRASVATLLRKTGSTVVCSVNGTSMGATLPQGSTLRIDFGTTTLRVGDVIAFHAGSQLVVHRIVARGAFGRARDYVVTQGDGALLVDHPMLADAALGIVREWKDGDHWTPIRSFHPSGSRRLTRRLLLWPVVAMLHIHHQAAFAVTAGAATLQFAVRKLRIGSTSHAS